MTQVCNNLVALDLLAGEKITAPTLPSFTTIMAPTLLLTSHFNVKLVIAHPRSWFFFLFFSFLGHWLGVFFFSTCPKDWQGTNQTLFLRPSLLTLREKSVEHIYCNPNFCITGQINSLTPLMLSISILAAMRIKY